MSSPTLLARFVAAGCLIVTPAAAHPGGHAHLSLFELVQHYAEPDHLAFAALAVLVGIAGYRWGRRLEAHAKARAIPTARPRDSGGSQP